MQPEITSTIINYIREKYPQLSNMKHQTLNIHTKENNLKINLNGSSVSVQRWSLQMDIHNPQLFDKIDKICEKLTKEELTKVTGNICKN